MLGLLGSRVSISGLFPGLATVLLILVLLAALAGLREVAWPLEDLIDAAGRVEAGDYSVTVSERGPRGFRTLGRALNSMIQRLRSDEILRRNLLADVTHELRTPVAVIQGSLEGMLDGVYPGDESHIRPILEETHVLSRLIEDLRTLSLAESGALELHREPTDLGVLGGEVVSSFRPQAGEAGIMLEAEIPEDLPMLDVDPVRIREVLANLAANALHHTSQGGRVLISAKLDLPVRRVVVSVADNGTGIAPAELPHIFDRFFKSRESRGSGLGLAIAKNLIAAHGGEITAESTLQVGTTIRFSLPLEPS
ncbi:MAG: HAMP domain-containing sensor histidine kinase [Anaerolineales bacterium]